MSQENPAADLRVVKGEPTDEELAALITAINVVAARTAKRSVPPSNWSAYWRSVRTPIHPGARNPIGASGRDGWRASTGPHR